MLARVRTAQHDKRLFGEGRIPVGLPPGGCGEGLDVPEEFSVQSSGNDQYGPVFRVRVTHDARLYVRCNLMI